MKIGKTALAALFLVLAVLPRGLEAQPLTADYLAAVALASQGKFSEARKAFQEIIAAAPPHERAGRCLKILEDLEAQKINHQTAAHLFKGLAYFYQDRLQKALAEANLAVQISPKYARAYGARGGYYFALGQHKKALADYRRALELDPQSDGAYYNRGCLYLDTEEYGRAIQNFDRAVKINPKFASAFYNRGIAHFRRGEFLWALADFKRAAEINPHLPEAQMNLGVVLEELGKYKEAATAYKKFLHSAPPRLSREIGYAKKRLEVLQK